MKLSQAKDFLPFVQAAAEGKTIQTKNSAFPSGWRDLELNEEMSSYGGVENYHRIKPTPKLRAWKPKEVPVGALVRLKSQCNEPTRYMIVGLNCNGDICISYPSVETSQYPASLYLQNWQHSLDNGKTWLPCGVEESE